MYTPDHINGSENQTEISRSVAALIDFYKAFNNQNMTLMSDNWLHSSSSIMSNPLGGVKHGWDEIESVYKNIFYGNVRVFVEFYDFEIVESESMFFAAGRERGHLTVNGKSIDLKIRTSRIFNKHNNKWKQIHHHGSIDEPDLLASYQNIILNTKKD